MTRCRATITRKNPKEDCFEVSKGGGIGKRCSLNGVNESRESLHNSPASPHTLENISLIDMEAESRPKSNPVAISPGKKEKKAKSKNGATVSKSADGTSFFQSCLNSFILICLTLFALNYLVILGLCSNWVSSGEFLLLLLPSLLRLIFPLSPCLCDTYQLIYLTIGASIGISGPHSERPVPVMHY